MKLNKEAPSTTSTSAVADPHDQAHKLSAYAAEPVVKLGLLLEPMVVGVHRARWIFFSGVGYSAAP